MKYRVIGEQTIEVETIVEADTPEEAKKIAADRDLTLCGIHNTGERWSKENWTWYNIRQFSLEVFEAEEAKK